MNLVTKRDLERIGVSEALADSAGTTAEYLRFRADAARLRSELGSLTTDEHDFVEQVRRARLDDYADTEGQNYADAHESTDRCVW